MTKRQSNVVELDVPTHADVWAVAVDSPASRQGNAGAGSTAHAR
jgi:hypothetical protein